MPTRGQRTAKRIEHVCQRCGRTFIRTEAHSKIAKFCSHSCRSKVNMENVDQIGERNPAWKGGRSEKICLQCGKIFRDYHRKNGRERQFCSRECFRLSRVKERVKSNCLHCGKEMFIKQNSFDKGWGKYCSQSCNIRHRKLWESCIGDKHHLWKGGITSENHAARTNQKMLNWKKSVFSRDGFHCILCGSDKPRIHAHHIIPFSESKKLRYDVENGATLCVGCHQLFHPEITTADYRKYFGGTYTGPYIEQMAGA